MENSVLPVMVSHGEGRAAFIDEIASSVIAKNVDPKHQTAKVIHSTQMAQKME
ncbi:MAG: hypothetical protein CM15mP12_8860 [Gammaproteobacteria bacterium]|nr:MAG: hypothetical protein CM15mP12_8860 [Gammaproteobacteria bacterium]